MDYDRGIETYTSQRVDLWRTERLNGPGDSGFSAHGSAIRALDVKSDFRSWHLMQLVPNSEPIRGLFLPHFSGAGRQELFSTGNHDGFCPDFGMLQPSYHTSATVRAWVDSWLPACYKASRPSTGGRDPGDVEVLPPKGMWSASFSYLDPTLARYTRTWDTTLKQVLSF